MNRTEIEFFEAYKRLDKLCGELLDCRNGVSEYISQMEAEDSAGFSIPSWTADYKGLKHVRWVRNQLAHESDRHNVCTKDDTAFVNSFRARILSQDDPFSRLRKAKKSKKKPAISGKSSRTEARRQVSKNKAAAIAVLIIGIIVAASLLIVFRVML